MEKPDLENCKDKQFEKWYWSAYNDKCINCINKCKQSHVVSVLGCLKYQGIQKEDEEK
jgi:hypothetical protein